MTTKEDLFNESGMRNCSDCKEHSGIVAELDAGEISMQRLEKSIENLRTDFSDHVSSSAKSTIAMLLGLLMCFLTGVVGIYVNSLHPKDTLSSQAEMTMLVKEITKAIKEAKKP
ncbi:hypothetical protein KAR91_61895 [Candidatus Pacearchaeota archaeon]|nr:hypothetical protein [Candidatus Pacearchaeota archaeon]